MEYFTYLLWTQCWQLTLLFALIWVLTRFLRKTRPHLALVLWVLFFVKCLVPPILLTPIGIFAWQTPAPPSVLPVATEIGQVEMAAGDPITSESDNLRSDAESTSQPSSGSAFRSTAASSGIVKVDPYRFSATIITVWGIGSLLFLSALAIYFFRAKRRFQRQRVSLPSWVNKYACTIKSTTGFDAGGGRLIVTSDYTGPLVFGFLRPEIVIPEQLLDDREMVKKVLAHEACHIWRKDHWLSGLQLLSQTLFWFHPFVWLASREANQLCEVCCDDDTLRLFNWAPKSYAKGLVDMLEYQRTLSPLYAFPGIRPVDITRDRIQRLLSSQRRVRFRKRLFGLAFVLALLIFPSGRTENWAIGLQTPTPRSLSSEGKADTSSISLDGEESEQHRRQMDFLIGSWNVQSPNGTSLGTSIFKYEKSGNMIREDWRATDGSTAQGITYFDPNQRCWKLTWVDSTGTIMDSQGRWKDDLLVLNGVATAKNGQTYRMKTHLKKANADSIKIELFVAESEKFPRISSSLYSRIIESQNELP